MKIIYVVQGSTGEYSDHREWLVCALETEIEAQEMVIACTKEGNRIRVLAQKEGYSYDYDVDADWRILVDDDYKKVNDGHKYDPKFYYDYSGFNYTYFPVELKTFNP